MNLPKYTCPNPIKDNLINSSDALNDFLPLLKEAEHISLDTEANSLHCYFEKMCLIQISIPGSDVLIDPLSGLDLQPLFAVLAERDLIIHDMDYDLRLLRRNGLQNFGKIFDTMLAARLVGSRELGLASLLQKHFNIVLVKSSQKADWSRRPLSEKMREYAVNDTRHLLSLARKLEEELRRLKRWDWFTETCDKVKDSTRQERWRDPDSLWRISGNRELQGRALAILRELWLWRDLEARQMNLPSFRVLHNDQLIEAVHRLDAGQPVEFLHIKDHAHQRLSMATEKALSLPESEWPKKAVVNPRERRMTPAQERYMNRLKERRDQVAKELEMDPFLIASKNVLEVVAKNPDNAHDKLMPWQRKLLEI